ncbi:MAG: FAD-dependent oxidoreductase [Proteobacteria bacterium]|nr:FAD-dependent oxidoreductase [Pseudomonadota bacterium]
MNTTIEESLIKTDLLVIGGGFGGLFAAIKAKQNGVEDVLIVDKGGVGLSGKSSMAAGGTVYFVPEMGDDLEDWTNAVFQGQSGLCNQDMVESYLIQSGDRLREFEKLGVVWSKGLFGEKLMRMPSRGISPCMMTVSMEHKGVVGGKALNVVLCKEAKRLGVRFLNKTFINDLIVQDGRTVGAVGCDRRTGEFRIVHSKAVVVAAADCSFRGNYCCVEAVTGDAFAWAFRAGVDLCNMEQLCSNTAPLDINFEGTGPAGQFGAVFTDKREEDFVLKYDPRGSTAELDIIVQSMAKEVSIGNGPPFYLDFREIEKKHPGANIEEMLYMKMGGWMPINIARLRKRGVTPLEDRVLWNPAIQTLRGGVMTDVNCKNHNVDGLFAAGIAQSMGPGLFNGWSSGRCMWSGSTAGKSAAGFVSDTSHAGLNDEIVGSLKRNLYNRDIKPDSGDLTSEEITVGLQKCVFDHRVSIAKTEKSLKAAQKEIDCIREEAMPRMRISNFHEFIRYKETENMLTTADLYLKSSLLRRESRGSHYREDYPETDPSQLKWIVLNGNLEQGYRFEELPWDRYRLQPQDLKTEGGDDD